MIRFEVARGKEPKPKVESRKAKKKIISSGDDETGRSTSNHYHELRANAKRQCRGQGQRRGQLPADLQQIIEHKLLAKTPQKNLLKVKEKGEFSSVFIKPDNFFFSIRFRFSFSFIYYFLMLSFTLESMCISIYTTKPTEFHLFNFNFSHPEPEPCTLITIIN